MRTFPSDPIIQNYADLLVQYALEVQPGQKVRFIIHELAKRMAYALQRSILKAGAIPLPVIRLDGLERQFFERATAEQIAQSYPLAMYAGLVQTMDAIVHIEPQSGVNEFRGLEEQTRGMQQAYAPIRALLNDKERNGKFKWTVALWPTKELAAEVGLSLKDYWKQIIVGCNLDHDDPVSKWRSIDAQLAVIKDKLNKLSINRLHVVGPNVDLWVTMGAMRRWVTGSGRNVPGYEIFFSPDWRGTHGWISFDDTPLYYNGVKIEGVRLQFDHGQLISATSRTNPLSLALLLSIPGAERLGEFSLTSNLSRITLPMGDTLYDENRRGNMHIALGASYPDSYTGDQSMMTSADWVNLGFNDPDCATHVDFITVQSREVHALLNDARVIKIYENGEFLV